MCQSTFNNQKQTYEVVSKFAFLGGVSESYFMNEFEPLKIEYFNELIQIKTARNIRNLNILRTTIEKNFSDINSQMNFDVKNLNQVNIKEITECISSLEKDGINIVTANTRLDKYIIKINSLISENINSCRIFFPEYIKWDFIKNLFIMPDGHTEQGVKKEGFKYQNNKALYPYQIYINFPPEKMNGNLLYNDKKFLSLVYEHNGKQFTDVDKVIECGKTSKEIISEFIYQSDKTTVFVDCENSDANKAYNMLSYLEKEHLSDRISKVVLYNDKNSSKLWETIKQYTNIYVENRMTHRIKEDKSLVDIQLAVGLCNDYHQTNIDSYILLASDSDYCGMIEEMPDVKFLVMTEYSKCSDATLNVLNDFGVNYCSLDEFETESNELLIKSFSKELENKLSKELDIENLSIMFNTVCHNSYTNITNEQKKEILYKYINSLNITIGSDGQVVVRTEE